MTDEDLGRDLTCFIVGPIGDRLEPPGTEGRLRYENATQMWENVFEPACHVFSLTPIRADKIAESGEIPEQIFTYLRDADVVVADLTGGNANVMYELGLRHTRDKITIQIGEHERLPFDVNTIRTVKFRRTEAGLIDARNSLIETIRAALEGSGNPVTATRVWNALEETLNPAQIASASALSFVSDDPADGDDELGRLDLLAEGEAALLKLGETLTEIGSLIEEMGEAAARNTPGATEGQTFAAKLNVMRSYVEALRSPSERLDEKSAEYYAQVESVDVMMKIIRDDFTADPDQMRDPNLGNFFFGVARLADGALEGSVGTTNMLHAVRHLRQQSRILKPVSKSIEHSLNRILRGNEMVAGWAETFRAIPGWTEPPLVEPEDEA